MKANDWYYGLGVMISVLTASFLTNWLGYPYLTWFVGGAMVGLSVQLFQVAPEKRTAKRIILCMVISGIAGSVSFNLIHYLMQ